MTAVGLLLALLAAPSHAADTDPFDPASSLPTGTGTLQGESPTLGEEGVQLGLHTAFAQNLAVLAFEDGRREPIVAGALPITLAGGYTYKDKFRIDAVVPVYGWVDVREVGGASAYQGAGMGDIRLQGTVPFFERGDSLQMAVVPRVEIPSGSQAALMSAGPNASLVASLGGELDSGFGYVGNLGVNVGPGDQLGGRGLGSAVDVLGGAFYRANENFRVGGELDVALSLNGGDSGPNHRGTAHLFAQNTLESGLALTVGGGTGLFGIGTPEYRVLAAVTYSKIDRDQDKDGVVDDLDHCITDPEDYDGFEDLDGCPEDDNDRDGLVDAEDNCPLEPEDIDEWEDENGCPDPDNDADTILDQADECPNTPGVAAFAGCPDTDGDGLADTVDACPNDAGPSETDGCPDRDSDLVPDFRDECPDEPRPADEDPAISDGCPKSVFVQGDQITFVEKILFATGKAVIRSESYPTLDAVVAVLEKSPWVEKVEVQGHTDNVGSETMNQRLSQARADAVRTYLLEKGIATGRLSSKGMGESNPRDTNRTPTGRANNRRVEFKILQQRPPEIELRRPPAVPGDTTEGAIDTTPPPTDVVVPAPAPEATPEPAGPGFLTVKIRGGGFADVHVDNKKLSRTAPFYDLELESGEHLIWITNYELKIDHTETVTVAPGETTVVDIGLPSALDDSPEESPWGAIDGPRGSSGADQGGGSPWDAPAPAPAPEPNNDSPWGEVLDDSAPAPAPAPQPEPDSPWGDLLDEDESGDEGSSSDEADESSDDGGGGRMNKRRGKRGK